MFLNRKKPNPGEPKPVNIGGVRVGLVGLDEAVEAVRKGGMASDDEIGRQLVEILKKNNYIPAAAEEEYRRDLARYYRKKLGLPVEAPEVAPGGLVVKVLGPGCARCKQLHEMVRDTIAREGVAADLEYVTDIAEFAAYGVMVTPALVINGEVKAVGKMPTSGEVAAWLRAAAGPPASE